MKVNIDSDLPSDQDSKDRDASETTESGGDDHDGEETVKSENNPNAKEPAHDPRTRLYIEDLERKIADYESKIGDIRQYVKTMETEIDQVRTRLTRDSEKNLDAKVGKFLKDLLPILDNFELSAKSVEGAAKGDALAQGIQMILNQFREFLKSAGLIRISSLGETFDPHVHEAITSRPVTKDSDRGRVVEEFKAGYKYKDSILRPAQVIVGAD